MGSVEDILQAWTRLEKAVISCLATIWIQPILGPYSAVRKPEKAGFGVPNAAPGFGSPNHGKGLEFQALSITHVKLALLTVNLAIHQAMAIFEDVKKIFFPSLRQAMLCPLLESSPFSTALIKMERRKSVLLSLDQMEPWQETLSLERRQAFHPHSFKATCHKNRFCRPKGSSHGLQSHTHTVSPRIH